MPHFGCTTEVDACVKQLLVCFHGGFLWHDRKILVDIELIASITGLPLAGVDLASFFTGKDKDTTLVKIMKEKYNLLRDTRGFNISSINNILFGL